MSDKALAELDRGENDIDQPGGWSYSNPAQADYDKKFRDITSTPDMKAVDDQGDAAIRNADSSRQAIQDREKKAVGDTAVGKGAQVAAGTIGGAAGTVASKIIGRINTRGGRAATIVVVLILLLLVGLGVITPSAILVHLKENGTSWMSKNTNVGVNYRLREQLSKRYFDDPSKCTGIKALCRFSPGMTDSEIKALRDTGKFMINDADIGGSGDKKFIKKMAFVGDNGNLIDVNKANFADMHAKNVTFRSAMNTVIDPKALTFRSIGALKKFSVFGVDRFKPLGEALSDSKALSYFREKFYSKKGTNLNIKPPISNDPDNPPSDQVKKNLGSLEAFDDFNSMADTLREGDLIADGPRAVVPDIDGLTPAKAADMAISTGLGGVKGGVLGVFAAVDSACSVYNTLRILNFGVKVLAAYQLIQYAGLFTTIADKQKVSEVSTAEIAFLASILLRPSTMPGSKGKDFSQSQGASLMFYGKVSQPTDLARFSLGNVGMQALNKVFEVFSLGGKSALVCAQVLSWWGQLSLAVLGILTSILSLGTGAVSGIALGATKGLAYSYVQQVMAPKLIPLIAGTMIPDPKKDPEGGYGAGNAIAAGLGAFGGQLGRAKGMRPLTKQQFAVVQNDPEVAMMKKIDDYKYYQLGLFDTDNPRSIQNRLALALRGATAARSSVGDYIGAAQVLIGNALHAPVQYATAADDEYGSRFCADEQVATVFGTNMDVELVRDANCNLIYGPDPLTISDSVSDSFKYSLPQTVQYMANNKHIDPNTSEPISDDYKVYRQLCVEGTDPIVDDYSADLSENTAMTPCFDTKDDKYRYFSVMSNHDDIESGITSAARDKLGFAQISSVAQPGSVNPPPTSGTISGDAKSAAAQILALARAGKITIVDFSTNPTSDKATRSLASQQLEDIAAGIPIGITNRCGFTIPGPITPNVSLLQFLVDFGGQYHYKLNSLFGQCHSQTSAHYRGEAVDLGCPTNTALADSIGTKYGVRHNSENCSQDKHWHYSIGGR